MNGLKKIKNVQVYQKYPASVGDQAHFNSRPDPAHYDFYLGLL